MKFGKIIGIFGLPCSGKSTLVRTIVDSSREVIAHISSGDIARGLSDDATIKHMNNTGSLFPGEDILRNKMLETIEKRRMQGANYIILDGFPRTPDQIIWMMENQLAGTRNDGCFIQIRGSDLLKRAAERYRDEGDKLENIKLKIIKQQEEISKLDKIIYQFAIPYYTIINDDLLVATKQMTKFIGLRK